LIDEKRARITTCILEERWVIRLHEAALTAARRRGG
jgi:hypothetical protein